MPHLMSSDLINIINNMISSFMRWFHLILNTMTSSFLHILILGYIYTVLTDANNDEFNNCKMLPEIGAKIAKSIFHANIFRKRAIILCFMQKLAKNCYRKEMIFPILSTLKNRNWNRNPQEQNYFATQNHKNLCFVAKCQNLTTLNLHVTLIMCWPNET